MASPTIEGVRNGEENAQMQPRSITGDDLDFSEFLNDHDMTFLDSDPALFDFDAIGNFNNSVDILSTQGPDRIHRFSQPFSSHTQRIVADGNNSQGNTYNIPRGGLCMEQIHHFLTPSFQMSNNKLELQRLTANPIIAAEDHDDLDYVLSAETQQAPKRARKKLSPSPEEWEVRKAEIRSLYVDYPYTLEATRSEMAERGFFAEASQYKRKFKEWGWETYGNNKAGGKLGEASSVNKPAKRSRGRGQHDSNTRASHPNSSSAVAAMATSSISNLARLGDRSTNFGSGPSHNNAFIPMHLQHAQLSTSFGPGVLRGTTAQSNSTPTTSMVAVIPQHYLHSGFDRTTSSLGTPTPIGSNDFDKLMNAILVSTKDLYIRYPAQKKWTVQKQCEVEENDHDDFLVGILTSANNYSSLSPEAGDAGFQKTLCMLETVVGSDEGADCGLFSLPAIWVSFVRLIQKKRFGWAQALLMRASSLALKKFGRDHSFVQVLFNLQKIWVNEPAQIEEVVFRTYRSCIASLGETLDPLNLTYLSLWADYVVYLEGTSTNETNLAVKNIRGVINILEEKHVPDGEQDSDYILELFGRMLYVLQSTPAMADEAEKVAMELLSRVERRRVRAGGSLEGDLFTTWKDLIQTLGTLCLNRKAYRKAESYLEEFLCLEIVDERDAIALEELEKCYQKLGKPDKARDVRQRWKNESKRLLNKTDTEPVVCENISNDQSLGYEEDGMDLSNKEGSSDGTVVDEVEATSERYLEEDESNETEDSEVERQVLREQVAEMEKRLHVLESSKGKGREKAS